MRSSALQRRQSDSHPHRISTWELIRHAAATEHNPTKLVSPQPSHSISYTHLPPFFGVVRGVWGCRGGKMGRQGQDGSAALPGMRMQRSQSRLSLSASFEALAVYFPCMNSFDEADGGKNEVTFQVWRMLKCPVFVKALFVSAQFGH